jgi:hypothetical protein
MGGLSARYLENYAYSFIVNRFLICFSSGLYKQITIYSIEAPSAFNIGFVQHDHSEAKALLCLNSGYRRFRIILSVVCL